MYAVIRSGGKQYRVAPGKTIRVEKLDGKVGGKVTFDEVLAVHNDDKELLAGEHVRQGQSDRQNRFPRRGREASGAEVQDAADNTISRAAIARRYTAVEVSDIKWSRGFLWRIKRVAVRRLTGGIRTGSGWESSASEVSWSPAAAF